MKIRNDYVSNSSSSSFIVIDGEPEKVDVEPYSYWFDPLVLPITIGCCEFGRQDVRYDDFWTKLNWCAIILSEIYNAKNNSNTYKIEESDPSWYIKLKEKMIDFANKYDEYVEMFERVCKEHFKIAIKLDFDKDRIFFFIDHQSGIFEKPENARMFESEDALYKFLASPHSYIQCLGV